MELLRPCKCGGNATLTTKQMSSGMDGGYTDWEISCNKCGGTWHYAADYFYGRKFFTQEEVIKKWNDEHTDVIERSRIDRAIEELRKEIEENHLNVIDYADGEWIIKDFVYGAIERFKKNIGE